MIQKSASWQARVCKVARNCQSNDSFVRKPPIGLRDSTQINVGQNAALWIVCVHQRECRVLQLRCPRLSYLCRLLQLLLLLWLHQESSKRWVRKSLAGKLFSSNPSSARSPMQSAAFSEQFTYQMPHATTLLDPNGKILSSTSISSAQTHSKLSILLPAPAPSFLSYDDVIEDFQSYERIL